MSSSPSLDSLIPPPDEVNDAHKVYSVAAACIALGIVAVMFVLARLCFRVYSRTLGPDDYAVMPAIVLYIGWTALAGYINLHAGVGKPLWEITVAEFSLWYKGIVVTTWLYPTMSAAIRISILLTYRRIFATSSSEVIKYVIWVLLGFQAVYVTTFVILPGFMCTSLHYFWDVYQHLSHCDNWYYFWSQIALYSASMSFDTILLLFPIIPVSKLRMPVKKRLGILIIFMLGAGASIAAAYKLAVFDLEMRRYVPTNSTWLRYEMSGFVPGQFDRYGTTFWIPSQVEPTVALIGTSLPALRPFLASASEHLSGFIATRFTSKISSFGSKQSGGSASARSESQGRFLPITNTSNIELHDIENKTSRKTADTGHL
ncbi:hypothetical protein F4818DRAFT_411766 [Hypoxylon cercidicola]|nr:hypothetical protein F4818DRAFT_411766 [Hypoxylon cercidicola]